MLARLVGLSYLCIRFRLETGPWAQDFDLWNGYMKTEK